MGAEFEHPKIFSDALDFCKIYYPIHQNFPKPFRYSVGVKVLDEIAQTLRYIVLANAVDKATQEGLMLGADYVRHVRSSIAVIRGFIMLAWHMKFLSHGALSELGSRMESMSKQAARWEQWYKNRCRSLI